MRASMLLLPSVEELNNNHYFYFTGNNAFALVTISEDFQTIWCTLVFQLPPRAAPMQKKPLKTKDVAQV
jgi:hypothetical protein